MTATVWQLFTYIYALIRIDIFFLLVINSYKVRRDKLVNLDDLRQSCVDMITVAQDLSIEEKL